MSYIKTGLVCCSNQVRTCGLTVKLCSARWHIFMMHYQKVISAMQQTMWQTANYEPSHVKVDEESVLPPVRCGTYWARMAGNRPRGTPPSTATNLDTLVAISTGLLHLIHNCNVVCVQSVHDVQNNCKMLCMLWCLWVTRSSSEE
jgi:hypothetical protein